MEQEPKWYIILNPIPIETNEPLNLTAGIEDTSFTLDDEDEEEDEEDSIDDSIDSTSGTPI